MRTPVSTLLSLALGALTATAVLTPTATQRTSAASTPAASRAEACVFVTRPARLPSWKAGELYRQDDMLSQVYQELDALGYDIDHIQTMTTQLREELYPEHRVVFFCRR